MDILTFFTPAEMAGLDTSADVVIVIDVLRGTTTMTAAFDAGASKIIPVLDIDMAFKINQKIGIEKSLLCGAHKNENIDGFDLGSSPLEYTPDKVKGKILVFYSINTSKAVDAARNSGRVLLSCFNNIQAVIESVEYPSKMYLLCTGKMGRFSFEDAVCAGMFIQRFIDSYSGEIGLNDASATSRHIYQRHRKNILKMLQQSSQGHFLTKIKSEKDLEFAARVDSVNIVGELSLDKTHILPTIALENVC